MTPGELFDLTGRVALVTGGGTHLGRAMAEALAAQGAQVFVAGRRPEPIAATARAISESGGTCSPIGLDITDDSAVDGAIEDIVGSAGRLDIAVCNAGANAEATYPPDTALDVFRATLDSHVVGTVATANAAARHMLDRGEGSIITVSSVHGSLAADPRLYDDLTQMSRRSSLAYQAAKAAILGVTRNLAAEFGRRGVRVNCISPGHIPKDEADPEFVRRVVDGNALGIKGRPDDLKGAVVLLASEAGRFITGHNLVVDAGWSIW